MPHQHIYDKEGKQLCCTQEEKIYSKAGASALLKNGHADNDGHDHGHEEGDGHDHASSSDSPIKMFLPAIVSMVLLLLAIALDSYVKPDWFAGWVRIIWYVVAYIPVGLPVLKEAVESIGKGEIFSEFLLILNLKMNQQISNQVNKSKS